MRDGKGIIANLYNDRDLLPDDEQPAALETVYRNRTRKVDTLFGCIEFQRNYLHHAKSGSGRFPLDSLLGLEDACTPAVARLMCRAASRAGSYQEGADDLEAYAGLRFDADGQPLRDADGGPLRDPDSTSYVGTYKGCREIAVLLHQEARRRGLHLAKRLVYIGDGAAWVWENCRLTFPDAIEILDFYHACEHVGQLAAAIHDEDPAQAALLRARWCHEMKQSSPAGLLTESRVLLKKHPEWSKAKREAILEQINYLENHSSRTCYGRYREEGLFIGSGVVEAGCKTVVGRRLKQSGMFWSEPGAENILSLRCLVLGPHFDATWKERRELLAKEQIKARRWTDDEIKQAA